MTAKRLVFTEKQKVEVEPFELRTVAADHVRIRTLYTLMSTGTENICFNRLFDPGTHWDDWVKYPHHPGYCAVGEIVETGSAVRDRSVGATVAYRGGHASEHVIPGSTAFAVPDGIEPQSAVWFTLAKIAFMGALASKHELGDTVLIVGAGPIGQMSVRWASAAGLGKIVVVDPVDFRLGLAMRGGATAVISKPIEDCREAVSAAFDGALPRVVIDSTGHAPILAAALGLTASFGRVVILGDTGSPTSQHLTMDVIRRGLTIIGAHDSHEDDKWNNATITTLLFDLVRRGRFDLSGLNSHFFTPEQAAEAYSLANTRRGETMGIVFDWTRR